MSQKWFANGITDAPHSKKDFHDELVSTVWAVVEGEEGGGNGTGFCVDKRGYILTCNHVCKNDEVYCFNLGPDDWFSKAKVLRRLPSWDMAIFELVDKAREYDYVRMSDELDKVFCGQDVYAIGNPNGLNKSFMMGKVGYSSDEYNLNMLDMDFKAADHDTHGASIHDPVELHRTIGNTSTEVDSPGLNPNVPIIQVGRFCVDVGASGSPVFNKRGSVVGMHFSSHARQALAIHFYALNHFIKVVYRELDGEVKSSKTEKEKEKEGRRKKRKIES